MAELQPLEPAARISLHAVAPDAPAVGYAAILVAPLFAGDLGPTLEAGPPRWIVGDAANAARLAEAARLAGAAGVLFTPVSAEAIGAIVSGEPAEPARDLARARSLVATSLIELAGNAAESLLTVASGFGANDCVVWWKDAGQMVPTAAPAISAR